MTASTCNEYSVYDTKIDVWCGGCEVPICIDGNDDDCLDYDELLSTVIWCSEAGSEYLILVHGYEINVGEFQLDVSDDGTPCDNPISCGGQQDIPTLSEWGMLIMELLIMAVGTVALVRRRKVAISKAA